MKISVAWRLWLVVGWVAVFAAGCDRTPAEYRPPEEPAAEVPVRVVSLAPALTKMMIDLGHGELIVGTASNDAAAPEGLPIVGTYTDVHTESLMSLNPTHVLMMTGKEGVPGALQQLADAKRFTLITYPTPKNIGEVLQIVHDPSELLPGGGSAGGTGQPSLSAIFSGPGASMGVYNDLLKRLAQLNEVTSGVERPRVLMVIDTHPIMASGPDTVLDDLLYSAGGRNAAGGARVSAPVYDREKLVEASPDVVLLFLPGAPALGELDQDPRLAELRGLPIPAVEKGRIALINDPFAQLPSTSLTAIGVEMVRHIHPELSDALDRALSVEALAADRDGVLEHESSPLGIAPGD